MKFAHKIVTSYWTYTMTDHQMSKANHTISALILAAGKGTRMKSALPKVMHPVMGRSMLEWVTDVVKKSGATEITLVLSPDTKPFEELLEEMNDVKVVIQKKARGTGDAVAASASAYSLARAPQWSEGCLWKGEPGSAQWVIICAGDTPAMQPSTIRDFIRDTMSSEFELGVIGMTVDDPRGYGRLLKFQNGTLDRIVEERDADAEIRKIRLCNTGVVFAKVSWLFDLLSEISPSNAQNEYYLTDIFAAASRRGKAAFIFEASQASQFAGVNDRAQLDLIERSMIRSKIADWMAHGVSLHLPDTVYVEADVTVEPDTRIYPGVCLRGKTRISRNCVLGPNSVIEDSVLGAGVQIGASSVLTRARISAGEVLAPQSLVADVEI